MIGPRIGLVSSHQDEVPVGVCLEGALLGLPQSNVLSLTILNGVLQEMMTSRDIITVVCDIITVT